MACGATREASLAMDASAAEEAVREANRIAAAEAARISAVTATRVSSTSPTAAPSATPTPSGHLRRRSKAPLVLGSLALLTLASLGVAVVVGGNSDTTADQSSSSGAAPASSEARSNSTLPAQAAAPGTTPAVVVDATSVAPAAPPTPGEVIPGDLGLAVPMAQPLCDGRYITFVGASVTPGKYESQIAEIMQTYPGTNYFLTEGKCSSLRARTDAGDQIYVVYYGPFGTAEQACGARGYGPPDAYVKQLNNVTSPSEAVDC